MMDKNQINFTPKAQKIVKDAKAEALLLNTKSADLEHLFIAFLDSENSMISEIFEEAKVNKAELRELVIEEFKKDTVQLNPD